MRSWLYLHELSYRFNDLECLGYRGLFQMPRVGDRDFFAANTRQRRIKFKECFFSEPHANFGRQTTAFPSFIDDDRAPGFRDRCNHGFHVQRTQAAQVDDFGRYLFAFKLRRRFQCFEQ